MFGRNTYLLNPQVSPSHHPRSVVDLNGVEILLHHGHPEMFSSHFLAANNTPPVVDSSLLHQDDGRAGLNNGDPNCGISANTFQRKQTSGKKDRHSKIFTSQGPRDRRVRLSIGIARKFFDLQEMLGFDKPSKTLDWLLTKSKAAIKDLVQSKQNSAKSISSPSECEVLSSAENGNYLMGADYSKKKLSNKSKGPAKDPQQVAASNLAKESRAKARARARERTIEKMCIKQMNGACKINGSVSDLNPYRNNESQLEGFQLSAKNPSFFGFHQQNYTIPSANTSTSENWDICSFTSQSNISAILDHHKFN